ncbi:MAG: ORF6N domain-containing protein [Planctomycetota bacterium]
MERRLHSGDVVTFQTIPLERIEQRIILVREQKVMLDSDLAELNEVETAALTRQVKRKARRASHCHLPAFMQSRFLSWEKACLRSLRCHR